MVSFKILLDNESDIWTIVNMLSCSELLASNAVNIATARPFYETLLDRTYFRKDKDLNENTLTVSVNADDFNGYKQLSLAKVTDKEQASYVFLFLSLLEKCFRLTDRHILTPESLARLDAYIQGRKIKQKILTQNYIEDLYNIVFM